MAIREILTSDDLRLREQSFAVEQFGTPELEELATDLVHTMLHGERAALGLAAPQIGVLLRVFAMREPLKGGRWKSYVFVNPEIIKSQGTMRFREGCLSFPDRSFVRTERAARVTLAWSEPDGTRRKRTFQGVFAVCVQHEIEHLDGKLMTDHGALEMLD